MTSFDGDWPPGAFAPIVSLSALDQIAVLEELKSEEFNVKEERRQLACRLKPVIVNPSTAVVAPKVAPVTRLPGYGPIQPYMALHSPQGSFKRTSQNPWVQPRPVGFFL